MRYCAKDEGKLRPSRCAVQCDECREMAEMAYEQDDLADQQLYWPDDRKLDDPRRGQAKDINRG